MTDQELTKIIHDQDKSIKKMTVAANELIKHSRKYLLKDRELRIAWYAMRRAIPIEILGSKEGENP